MPQMQLLQHRLEQRFPHWFRGHRARLARPVLRGVARWSRLDAVQAFLDAHGRRHGFDFVHAVLEHLGVPRVVDDAALRRVPAHGPLLVVANHPSGALDALTLLDAIGRVRRDVRIVANEVLSGLEPLRDLLLPVRILGGRPRPGEVEAIDAALDAGQCVVIFPAGEVSRLSMRGVRDTRWRPGFVRFAQRSGAPVLPVHVAARNSALFYGASALFKPAGTALLAREMFARRTQPLRLHVGPLLRIAPGESVRDALRRVRTALYALPSRAQGPVQQPLAPAEDGAAVAAAIARMPSLGATSDGKEIRIGRLPSDSPVLRQLGRERERTFRAVGEGSGLARDLDDFDAQYQQIVLWDAAVRRIVGGYRLQRGSRALAERGLAGLYTASLFRYADDALPRLAQGVELGRSFVVPECWGGRSLDYLWQGIGAYLRRHPRVRYLYGPVSISAALPLAAREQLVAYYQRFHGDAGTLAASLRPFRYIAEPPEFGAIDRDTAYEVLRQNLAAIGAQVPTLYKQYTELCEPGGARFLAFGIDPDFSDAIDGLIEVDLATMRPHKRRRYLEPREAQPA